MPAVNKSVAKSTRSAQSSAPDSVTRSGLRRDLATPADKSSVSPMKQKKAAVSPIPSKTNKPSGSVDRTAGQRGSSSARRSSSASTASGPLSRSRSATPQSRPVTPSPSIDGKAASTPSAHTRSGGSGGSASQPATSSMTRGQKSAAVGKSRSSSPMVTNGDSKLQSKASLRSSSSASQKTLSSPVANKTPNVAKTPTKKGGAIASKPQSSKGDDEESAKPQTRSTPQQNEAPSSGTTPSKPSATPKKDLPAVKVGATAAKTAKATAANKIASKHNDAKTATPDIGAGSSSTTVTTATGATSTTTPTVTIVTRAGKFEEVSVNPSTASRAKAAAQLKKGTAAKGNTSPESRSVLRRTTRQGSVAASDLPKRKLSSGPEPVVEPKRTRLSSGKDNGKVSNEESGSDVADESEDSEDGELSDSTDGEQESSPKADDDKSAMDDAETSIENEDEEVKNDEDGETEAKAGNANGFQNGVSADLKAKNSSLLRKNKRLKQELKLEARRTKRLMKKFQVAAHDKTKLKMQLDSKAKHLKECEVNLQQSNVMCATFKEKRTSVVKSLIVSRVESEKQRSKLEEDQKTIETLRARVEELNQQESFLKSKNQEYEERLAKSEMKNQEITAQLEQIGADCVAMEEERRQHKEKVAMLGASLADLQQKYAEEQEKVSEHLKYIDDCDATHSAEIDEQKRETIKVRKELDASENSRRELESKIAALEGEKAATEKTNKDKDLCHAREVDQLSNERVGLEQKLANLAEEKAGLVRSKEEAQDFLQKARAKLVWAESEIKKGDERIQSLINEADSLNKQREAEKESAFKDKDLFHAQKVQELEEDKAAVSQKLIVLEEKLEQSRKVENTLKSALVKQNQQIKLLDDTNKNFENQLKNENSEKAKYQSLMSKIKRAAEETTHLLNDCLENSGKPSATVKNILENRETVNQAILSISKAGKDLKASHDKISLLESSLNEAKAAIGKKSEQIAGLDKEVESLQVRLKETETSKAQEILALKIELEEKIAENDTLRRNLFDKAEQIDRARSRIENMKKTFNSYDANLSVERDTLRKELDIAKDELMKTKEANDKLMEANKTNERMIEAKNAELADLTARLSEDKKCANHLKTIEKYKGLYETAKRALSAALEPKDDDEDEDGDDADLGKAEEDKKKEEIMRKKYIQARDVKPNIKALREADSKLRLSRHLSEARSCAETSSQTSLDEGRQPEPAEAMETDEDQSEAVAGSRQCDSSTVSSNKDNSTSSPSVDKSSDEGSIQPQDSLSANRGHEKEAISDEANKAAQGSTGVVAESPDNSSKEQEASNDLMVEPTAGVVDGNDQDRQKEREKTTASPATGGSQEDNAISTPPAELKAAEGQPVGGKESPANVEQNDSQSPSDSSGGQGENGEVSTEVQKRQLNGIFMEHISKYELKCKSCTLMNKDCQKCIDFIKKFFKQAFKTFSEAHETCLSPKLIYDVLAECIRRMLGNEINLPSFRACQKLLQKALKGDQSDQTQLQEERASPQSSELALAVDSAPLRAPMPTSSPLQLVPTSSLQANISAVGQPTYVHVPQQRHGVLSSQISNPTAVDPRMTQLPGTSMTQQQLITQMTSQQRIPSVTSQQLITPMASQQRIPPMASQRLVSPAQQMAPTMTSHQLNSQMTSHAQINRHIMQRNNPQLMGARGPQAQVPAQHMNAHVQPTPHLMSQEGQMQMQMQREMVIRASQSTLQQSLQAQGANFNPDRQANLPPSYQYAYDGRRQYPQNTFPPGSQ